MPDQVGHDKGKRPILTRVCCMTGTKAARAAATKHRAMRWCESRPPKAKRRRHAPRGCQH